MELRHLRALVAVADEGSVTAAARRLGLAQPPLSRTLAALEAELGVVLLERTSRRSVLTPAGAEVLMHARAALRAAERVEETARRVAAGEAGKVRVGLVRPAYGLLAEAIAELRSLRPGVEVTVAPSTTGRLLTLLALGELDLAFVAAPFARDGLDGVPVARFELRAAVPREHRLAQRGSIALADLREEGWVLLPGLDVGLSAVIVDACRTAGFYPVVDAHADELGAILALVAAGAGVTLVPPEEAVEHLPVVYLDVDDAPGVDVHMIWPRRPHPARDALVRLLQAQPRR